MAPGYGMLATKMNKGSRGMTQDSSRKLFLNLARFDLVTIFSHIV